MKKIIVCIIALLIVPVFIFVSLRTGIIRKKGAGVRRAALSRADIEETRAGLEAAPAVTRISIAGFDFQGAGRSRGAVRGESVFLPVDSGWSAVQANFSTPLDLTDGMLFFRVNVKKGKPVLRIVPTDLHRWTAHRADAYGKVLVPGWQDVTVTREDIDIGVDKGRIVSLRLYIELPPSSECANSEIEIKDFQKVVIARNQS
jgi:hypothetical protein